MLVKHRKEFTRLVGNEKNILETKSTKRVFICSC